MILVPWFDDGELELVRASCGCRGVPRTVNGRRCLDVVLVCERPEHEFTVGRTIPVDPLAPVAQASRWRVWLELVLELVRGRRS